MSAKDYKMASGKRSFAVEKTLMPSPIVKTTLAQDLSRDWIIYDVGGSRTVVRRAVLFNFSIAVNGHIEARMASVLRGRERYYIPYAHSSFFLRVT